MRTLFRRWGATLYLWKVIVEFGLFKDPELPLLSILLLNYSSEIRMFTIVRVDVLRFCVGIHIDL